MRKHSPWLEYYSCYQSVSRTLMTIYRERKLLDIVGIKERFLTLENRLKEANIAGPSTKDFDERRGFEEGTDHRKPTLLDLIRSLKNR